MKTLYLLLGLILLISCNSAFSQPKVQKEEYQKTVFTDTINQWSQIISLSIYGGGSLFGLVTSSETIEEQTSPSGSVGLNFSTIRLTGNLFFTYNGKKTVEMMNLNQFGNSLMNSHIGGQSISFNLIAKLGKKSSWRSGEKYGLSGSILLADNLWKLDSLKVIDASPLITRIGFYWKPFNFEGFSSPNKIDLELKSHFTHRAIHGDFGNNDQYIQNQLVKRRGYNGFDFSANITLNSVELFVQTSINQKGEFEVPGFTGTQILFGVNVTGDLITLLPEAKNKNNN